MKIRFATLDDIPAFIELGPKFQAHTRYRSYNFNPERVAANLQAAIENARGIHCFFVAVDSTDKPVGGADRLR